MCSNRNCEKSGKSQKIYIKKGYSWKGVASTVKITLRGWVLIITIGVGTCQCWWVFGTNLKIRLQDILKMKTSRNEVCPSLWTWYLGVPSLRRKDQTFKQPTVFGSTKSKMKKQKLFKNK